MGLEPTTTSLATRYSTTELHPHSRHSALPFSRLSQSLFQEEIIGAGMTGQWRRADIRDTIYCLEDGSSNLFQSGMSMAPRGLSIR
jgi:hypothetical protein